MKAEGKDLEHLMSLWEARQAVSNLMGRLSADYVINEERGMYNAYWSKREDVCLGVNDGYFSGAEAVQGYYAAWDSYHKLVRELVKKQFPQQTAGKTDEELYGIGTFGYRPIDTPVIEVADDLQTAKGIWCSRANQIHFESFGNLSYWDWGWMAADFVLEADGSYKIWHLLLLSELLHPCDQKIGEPLPERPEIPEFQPIRDFQFPKPNVQKTVRELYSPVRPYTRPPRFPDPYQTFSETFTYGM